MDRNQKRSVYCNFCDVEYYLNQYEFGSHKRNCNKNPNKALIIEKTKGNRIERKLFKFKCEKCNSEYVLVLKITDFKKKKYKKFCGVGCANSRNITENVKKNISVGMIKSEKTKRLKFEKNCLNCSKKMLLTKYEYKNRIFCCISCSSKYTRKKFLKEHPDMHPNRLCAGKKSYWQKTLYENLVNKNANLKYEQIYDGYWMDIVEPNKKINIEYDGIYWHNIDNDINRDNALKNLGWKILRISSEELNYKNRQIFPNIIKRCLDFIN